MIPIWSSRDDEAGDCFQAVMWKVVLTAIAPDLAESFYIAMRNYGLQEPVLIDE